MGIQPFLFDLVYEITVAQKKLNRKQFVCNICEDHHLWKLERVIKHIVKLPEYRVRLVDHPDTKEEQYRYNDPEYWDTQCTSTFGFYFVRKELLKHLKEISIELINNPPKQNEKNHLSARVVSGNYSSKRAKLR